MLRALALERDKRCVWCKAIGAETDCSPVLEMAHAHGIGMGGRKSVDTLDGVVMLGQAHHDMLDGRQLSGRRHDLAELLAAVVRFQNPWPTSPAVPEE